MVLASLRFIPLVPASGPNITIIPNSGILDLIFHQTWIAFKILGWPQGAPITLNLIQLIIFAILALAALAVTERLTGSKPGGMLAGVIITIFGAWLITHFVFLPGNLGLSIEGVPIIAALLGAIIVAVFYVLIRKQFGGK
jgi:uncharacterized membrane protein YeaQ/YmgE (transglycosylase-associated protein family)